MRRLAVARGLLENDRLKRLRKLSDVLYKFRNLDVLAQERATELLRQLSLESDTPLPAVAKPSTPSDATRNARYVEMITGYPTDSIPGLTSEDEREALFSLGWQESPSSTMSMASGAERNVGSGSLPSNKLPSADDSAFIDAEEPEDIVSLDSITSGQPSEDSASLSSDQHLPEGTENICANGPPQQVFRETEATVQRSSPWSVAQSDTGLLDPPLYGDSTLPQEDEDVNTTFASLYFDFCQSISKYALLTARETSMLTPSASTRPPDPDTQTEIVMTKAQYQLMLDEKRFWEHLVSSPSIIMDSSEEEFSCAVETLVNLTHTSNVMSESYQRRTNPPTAQTYEESKEIIQAMGMPCVDAVGPFEAEALASSIVLSGLADYVASEDTVRMPTLPRYNLSCNKRFAGCFGL
jgi:flap endonuclease-1